MAKETINKNYVNGTMYEDEEGNILLDEVKKDDVKTYNISALVKSLVGSENVSITIKANKEITPDA